MERLYNYFKSFVNQAFALIHKYPIASFFIISFYIVYIYIVFSDKKKKTGKHIRGARIIKNGNFFRNIFLEKELIKMKILR